MFARYKALKRGHRKDDTRYNSFFSFLSAVGALLSIAPIFLISQPTSGGAVVNNNYDYASWHIVVIRDFAMINLGLIIPSIVNAVLDKIHEFQSAGAAVLGGSGGGGGGSGVGHEDNSKGAGGSNTTTLGLSPIERIKLLLGIAVSSIFVFLVSSETLAASVGSSSSSSASYRQQAAAQAIATSSQDDYATMVFMACICSTMVLSGSTLTTSLRRLCGGLRRLSWNGPRSAVTLFTLVGGALCFSWGTYRELAAYPITPSLSSSGGGGGIGVFVVGVVMWVISLLVFIFSSYRWFREAILLAKLTPSSRDNKRSRLNIYVPMMLIGTKVFSMVVVLAVVISLTLGQRQSSFLRVNNAQLEAYFVLLSVITLLVVVLELRLKTFEINEGMAALESKRSFVRYISHEVRTPLNTVCLGLELLSEELNNSHTDSEEVHGYRDCVDQIREAAGIAVEILNDLLQYDKMQDNSHSSQLQRSPHHAINMVNEIFNTFKIQARKGGVSFVSEFLNPPPMMNADGLLDEIHTRMLFAQALIKIDKPKIAQVIRNFMSNALKFTPPGGVVTVSVRLADTLGPAITGADTYRGSTGKGGSEAGRNRFGTTGAIDGGSKPHGASLSRLGSSMKGFILRGVSSSSKIKGRVTDMPSCAPPRSNSNMQQQVVSHPDSDIGELRSPSSAVVGVAAAATITAGAGAGGGGVGEEQTPLTNYSSVLSSFMPLFIRRGRGMSSSASAASSRSRSRGTRGSGAAGAAASVNKSKSNKPKFFILEVTDTGVGIEGGNIDRIFNEIVQFNPNELQGGGGSGLGLYLSRSIIAAHKGKVWLTSEGLGKGCTFGFGIPVKFEGDTTSRRFFNNLVGFFGGSNKKGVAPADAARRPVLSAAGDTGRMSAMPGAAAVASSANGAGAGAPIVSPVLLPQGGGFSGGPRRQSGAGTSRTAAAATGRGRGRFITPFGTVLRGVSVSSLGEMNSGITAVSAAYDQGASIMSPPAPGLGALGRPRSFNVSQSSLMHTAEGGLLMQKLYYNAAGGTAPVGGGRPSAMSQGGRNNSNGAMNIMLTRSGGGSVDGGYDDQQLLQMELAPRRSSVFSGVLSVGGGRGGDDNDFDGESKLDEELHAAGGGGAYPFRHSVSERDLSIGQNNRSNSCSNLLLTSSHFKPRNPVAVVLADMEPSSEMRVQSFESPPAALNTQRSFSFIGGIYSWKKAEATASAAVVLKKYHVLVVDDSSLNRRMICKALASINCTTEEAEDGQKAVEMVERSLLLPAPLPPVEGPGGEQLQQQQQQQQPRGRSLKDVVNRKKNATATTAAVVASAAGGGGGGGALKMLTSSLQQAPSSSSSSVAAVTTVAGGARGPSLSTNYPFDHSRLSIAPLGISEENSRDLVSSSDQRGSISKRLSAEGMLPRPKSSSDVLSSEYEHQQQHREALIGAAVEGAGPVRSPGRLSFPVANSDKMLRGSFQGIGAGAVGGGGSHHASANNSVSNSVRMIEQSIAIARRSVSVSELPPVAEVEAVVTPTIADLEGEGEGGGEHSITSTSSSAATAAAAAAGNRTTTLRRYDFILCDNVMPRMDGPTAVQKIRAMGYINPIFGVTGNVLPSDVEHFITHGATSVLGKPLKLSLLKSAIKEYVSEDSNNNSKSVERRRSIFL